MTSGGEQTQRPTMSQAMTEAQAKLIDGVAKALAPKFDGLAVEIAELQASGGEVQTLLARIDDRLTGLERLATRLDALETIGGKAGAAGAAGPKRPPRPERKVGPAPAQAPRGSQTPPPGGGEDGYEKVSNSMQFCRRKYADDASFRDRYVTEEARGTLDADPSVTKFAPGSEDRLLAEGRILWAKCLTPEKKADIKREFTTFKEERACTQMRDPLGEAPLEEADA